MFLRRVSNHRSELLEQQPKNDLALTFAVIRVIRDSSLCAFRVICGERNRVCHWLGRKLLL
jgi:hypothetical protein